VAAAVLVGAVAGALFTPTTASLAPGPAAAAGDSIPTARSFDGVPAVGALFLGSAEAAHGCTGSVLRSPARNLVLTSAHCLSGGGTGVRFAPGYHDGLAPYGVWSVTAVYADPRWVTAQDPRYDYAFLAVDPQRWQGRETRLGEVVPGNRLRVTLAPGTAAEIVAYPAGVDDKPVTCTSAIYVSAGYSAFDCHGFVAGTSGAPWLVRADRADRGDRGSAGVVAGVIGGLHQGGCVESTSYSPRFDRDTIAVYQRAVHGTAPDLLPEPGSDGC
jgi:V8-like Glu-specific endopeptidase